MLVNINSFLFGGVLCISFCLIGLIFTIRCKLLQIRAFPEMISEVVNSFSRSKCGGISPFEAMSTALSGTMGTGNIIGVAAAISIGGVGALFWMIVSAFFCMIIKYAEVSLSVHYRISDNGKIKGGTMYYILFGLGERFLPLCYIFCFGTMFASFGIGASAQSSAVQSSISNAFAIDNSVIGLCLCIAAACVINGNAKSITRFTSFLVPFMTLTYIIGAASVLILNYSRLPCAFLSIVRGAFADADAAGGGMVGLLMNVSLRQGFSKGMFTNEAGMGSAPLIHCTAENTPHKQGLLGMFEVFLDTVVMCSITSLVIIVTDCENMPANVMTASSFASVFGKFGYIFIAVSVTLFAFGAIVGWSYYGSVCCDFIFHSKVAVFIYRFAYCIMIYLGAVMPISFILEVSDLLNGLMALPNVFAIFLLRKDVFSFSKRQNNNGLP